MAFANIIDYFNLNGDVLQAISSNDGASRSIVKLAHCVHYDVFSQGDKLFNPNVTYAVVGGGEVSFQLGKAFEYGGKHFMLVSVIVNTQAGSHPTVTFSAVANEGYDAVAAMTSNEDGVKIEGMAFTIKPRSRSQDVAGAFASTSESIVSISTEYAVDPIVVFGDGVPVASDVVHPRCTVSAQLLNDASYVLNNDEKHSDWKVVSESESHGEVDFGTHSITVEKCEGWYYKPPEPILT